MKVKYNTKLEAAWAFALCCVRFAGVKEGSKEHLTLLSWYNSIRPLPRNHTMTKDDAWCAAFLSAVAWYLGWTTFPFECSCSQMLARAREMGLDTWGRGHEPAIGDLLIYDLDKNNRIDHIGAVVWVDGNEAWIVEGNYSDSVKLRRIRIDDPIIYAWIVPNWSELVDNSNWVGSDRPNIPVEVPEIETEEETAMLYNKVEEMPEWAQAAVQELIDDGTIEGVGGGELGMTLADVRQAVWLWRRTGGGK